jgi:VCBS repeat-containing protein
VQRKYLCFLVVAIGLFFSSPRLSAQTSQSVTLAWDPSPDPDVVGYVVYCGGTSGVYAYATNVTNQTSAQMTGLQSGQTYFFAVTARDSLGMESLPSNEISYQVPVSTPPTIALTSPSAGATYTAPAIINLTAVVTANGHTITKIQFYSGATLLGEVAASPYSFTWNSVSAGSYSLTARLVYDAGSTLDSAPANALVTTPVNATPVANNDSYTIAEDTVLNVSASGVLANDTDADGNPLTAVLATGPAHGTLTLNANGSFIYTPAANYNGADSFTYRAADGALSSGAATVTITISPGLVSPGLISINASDGQITLRWTSIPGRRYQIQTTGDLTANSWIDVGSEIVADDVTLSYTSVIGAERQRFYTLILLE